MPGSTRSPPCETPRRVGRCSGSWAGWCKLFPSQLWLWDAAYGSSCSSMPSANEKQRCSQHSNAAHRGSNFLLISLTHHFISQCLGSGYLYLSQKTNDHKRYFAFISSKKNYHEILIYLSCSSEFQSLIISHVCLHCPVLNFFPDFSSPWGIHSSHNCEMERKKARLTSFSFHLPQCLTQMFTLAPQMYKLLSKPRHSRFPR